MRAAELGHIQVMKLLQKADSDPKIKDIDGKGSRSLKNSFIHQRKSRNFSSYLRCSFLLSCCAYSSP